MTAHLLARMRRFAPAAVSIVATSLAGAEAGPPSDLHRALRSGQPAAWRAQLDRQTDVNARDEHGQTALHLAALRNDAEAVEALLAKGADARATNDAGATPLHYGVASDRIVAALLAHGAPVDAVTKFDLTPLRIAVTHGDSWAVARRLVAAGANVNHRPAKGPPVAAPFGVLAAAIRGGDRRTVELLLERGADLAPEGMSPLTAAVLAGDGETTRLLLQRGARPTPPSKPAPPPFAAAVMRRNADLARLLLAHGADPKTPWVDRRRTPPMVFAGYNDTGDPTLARLLLEHGADVNVADEAGDTALSYALKRGPDTPLVHVLREAGAREPVTAARDKTVPSRPIPAEPDRRAAMVRDSVQRAIDRLQPASREFLGTPFVRDRKCTSCHHESLPAVVYGLARERGLRVDDVEFGRTSHAIVSKLLAQTEAARQMIDPVPNSRVTLGYDADALQAIGYARDDMTDAMARHLLDWQDRDGSWKAPVPRGPMEDQLYVGTAWSVRLIQLFPPAGREHDVAAALRRARDWLAAQRPALLNDQVFQLLGLAWADDTAARMRPFADRLIAAQGDDGGWAQLATWGSDAWATGSALLALQRAGIPPSDPAYQRGVDFLLRTQFDDGSWWVRSRSWPVQPHFDSRFPHGKDQWISAGGTAFAAIALLHTLPAVVPRERIPGADALIARFTAATAQGSPARTDATSVSAAAVTPAPAGAVSFVRDIKPIVERSCAGCHVGEKVKGGFSLASRASLLKGGLSGEPAIVPGRSGEGLLLRYIADEIEDLEMPPLARRAKYPALTPAEIALLRRWIDAGAVWDEPEKAVSQ